VTAPARAVIKQRAELGFYPARGFGADMAPAWHIVERDPKRRVLYMSAYFLRHHLDRLPDRCEGGMSQSGYSETVESDDSKVTRDCESCRLQSAQYPDRDDVCASDDGP
jgi:hypothetical protein